MKILLLGASGFLGRNLLLGAPDNWETIAVYRSDETFPGFLRERGLQNVTPLRCTDDGTWFDELREAVGGSVDACVVAWGNSDIALSVENPLDDLSANVVTLLHLLASVEMGRMVFVSSGSVYLGNEGLVSESAPTNPTVPYGVSKLASELYIQSHAEHRQPNMNFVIARFFGAFGPYERPRKIYTKLVQSFAFNHERTFTVRGDGTNLIDAMVVSDAVAGLIRMVEAPVKNVIVNFAAGDPCSISDLIYRAASVLGIEDVQVIHEGVTKEPISFVADTTRMKQLFDFEPQASFEDGILALRDHL
ncbi:MAG: NAD(P)-dependent oxidoreductase, partial [Gemmatimonadetes bacterium]|nr:NAD(P)-dependent oxidoreductase [Gemmatimonadota bacterium]